MRGTLPDEAQPWLHSKPMDATIRRIAPVAAMVDDFE